MNTYTIRLVTPADAGAYVATHTQALIETYSPIMPTSFAAGRLAEIPEYTAKRAEAFEQMSAALSAGRTPSHLFWVATDAEGNVVGVASSGEATPPWEHLHDMPAPLVDFQLDHIYTLSSAHGTGLGQRLLDAALPNGKGAHLWILGGNPRARAFYERNRFVPDGFETHCAPVWFERPMYRMWRPDA